MLFILSLGIACILVALLGTSIKQYPVRYYIGTVVVTLLFVTYIQLGLSAHVPALFNQYVIGMFSKSALSTALFTLVMYAGVMDKKKTVTKHLYKVRGEISIIACILTLGHNFLFGQRGFVVLFTSPSSLPPLRFIASISSFVMILLMLPLMITSFPRVRRHMKGKKWKKVQRLAYVFYGLIYVHIMCFFAPNIQNGKLLEVIIYSVVFIGYFVLRIRKFVTSTKCLPKNIVKA